ncbi:hypothetical protein Taro_018457 [Colocasia esculenta]|uniref:cytokinin riboside 5'-monophosphate phosphoribohydrolase n=1 Tax=Colocasia esculenta TaxID=4460 RepID=A0A843UR20_COLES|nr:hypothetical protein [Colocasia esculenta]
MNIYNYLPIARGAGVEKGGVGSLPSVPGCLAFSLLRRKRRGGKGAAFLPCGCAYSLVAREADRAGFWDLKAGGEERALPSPPCFPRARGRLVDWVLGAFFLHVVTPAGASEGVDELSEEGEKVSTINFKRPEMDGAANSSFKRVCVFCGSNSGNRSVFSDAAMELGHELVKRRINLVYGGGSVGLMGLISQTVHDGGCHVLGVIPTALMPLEISRRTVGEVRTVSDMHERKAEMARQSDAFIALPGGYGTMEELLEMITWSQLGIHNKPVGLLNVDGYYNSLLALFDNGVEEGFINPTARHIVISAPTAKELLIKMEVTVQTHLHDIWKFCRQYIPSHEQVAPSKSWEIANLGYSKRSNPT